MEIKEKADMQSSEKGNFYISGCMSWTLMLLLADKLTTPFKKISALSVSGLLICISIT